MTPDEPSASPGDAPSLSPADLLARGLESAKPATGSPQMWQPPTPEELSRLLPQYEIEALLGRGGMGAVYRGKQAALDRAVAIKLLPSELAAEPEFLTRFQREARTLAKLQHPGIVAVHDFGQTSRGHLYFVMEFVNGTDLARLIHGPGLNPAQALEIVTQVCDALQYAHGQGVIHRDIKPANVLLTQEGRAKLADFGLARPLTEDSGGLTRSHLVMGTPDYMAPEQMAGTADHRADLYALGVMLYEMLTGQTPRGAWAPPSQRVQVDVRLDQVVVRALQQDPALRYQQASEIKTDVDVIRTTPLPKVGKAKAKSAPAAPGQRTTPLPKAKKPVNKAAWVAAVVVALILGTSAWFFQQHRAKDILVTATKDAPFVNSLGMKFVPVPGTDILMCIHETRRKDYAAYADAVPGVDATWKNPSKGGKPLMQNNDHPVVQVSWEDASAFCAWLSKKEGRTYRLPTEREWNLAVVAFALNEPRSISDAALMEMLKAQYPAGTSNDQEMLRHGNYIEKADGYEGTAPVMSFLPNRLGIFDLGGNAWEWCDGWVDIKEGTRVLRGCGFLNYGPYRVSATRAGHDPGYRNPIKDLYPGFRVVVELAPSERAAKVDEPKPALVTSSAAVLDAREHGGRLRVFGRGPTGIFDLGEAGKFDDYIQVVVNHLGWAARRKNGDTHLGSWGHQGQAMLPFGPYSTKFLSRAAYINMLLNEPGLARNVWSQTSQVNTNVPPFTRSLIAAMNQYFALGPRGEQTRLFGEGKDDSKDFFLGATAVSGTEDHLVIIRPGEVVKSWCPKNKTLHAFANETMDVVEIDGAREFVALRHGDGRVSLAAPDGKPLPSSAFLTAHEATGTGFVAVRAGRGMAAAQKPDGSWVAWGDSEKLAAKVAELGHVIDLDFDYDGKQSELLMWIEPVDGSAAAAAAKMPSPANDQAIAEAKKRLAEARAHFKAGDLAETRKLVEAALATAPGDLTTQAEAALIFAEAQAPERAGVLAQEFVAKAEAEHPQFAAITELRVKLAPTLKQYDQHLRTAAELVGKGDDAGEIRELKAALALVPDGKQAAENLAANPLHVGRALPGRRFANELGHTFVPVDGLPNVLFSTWETRVKDFEQFVKETGHDMSGLKIMDGDKTRTWRKPGFEQTGDHPVVCVSREDAETFCRWLTDKERAAGRLLPGQVYRLPTDREWSAAMGVLDEPGDFPANRKFPRDVFTWPKGADPPHNAENLSWRNDDFASTAPVGSGKPNRFGLQDLFGNVREICADPFDFSYPHGMLRGASFERGTQADRMALGDMSGGSFWGSADIGFRCVLDLKTEPQRQAQIAFEQAWQKFCAAASPQNLPIHRRARAVINDEMVLLDLSRTNYSSEQTLDLFAAVPVTHLIASGGNLKGAMQVTKKWPLRSVFLSTLTQATEDFLESFRGLPLEWAYLALHPDGPMAVKSLDALTGMKLKGLYLDSFKNLQSLEPLRGMPLQRFVLNGHTASLDLTPLKNTPLRSYFVPRLISLEQFLDTCDWWGPTLNQLESDGAGFFRRFFLDAALTGQPAKVQEVKDTLSLKLAGFPVFKGWLQTLDSADTKKNLESAMAVARFVGGDTTAFAGQFQIFQGHAYLYWDQGLPLDEAKAFAAKLGGHLITITSKEENDFLIQQMEAGVFLKDFMLGLERIAPGRMGWKWVTGEPLAYHNWGPESGSTGDCAVFVQDKGRWVWFHGGKWSLSRFIIEWDTPTPQPPGRE